MNPDDRVSMVIEGTIGTAVATLNLLKQEIDGDGVLVDTGSGWTAPVKVNNIRYKDAVTLKQLIEEHNFKVTIQPTLT